MSTLKQAMERLAKAGIEPAAPPENEQKDDTLSEQRAVLTRAYPQIPWEQMDAALCEQVYERYLADLTSRKRDHYGRAQMYYHRTARCPAIARRKPVPSFVDSVRPHLVRENDAIFELNARLMSEQNYAVAMSEWVCSKDPSLLLIRPTHHSTWLAAQERALRIEVEHYLEQFETHRRWLLNLREGRIPLPSDHKLGAALKEAAREVLE